MKRKVYATMDWFDVAEQPKSFEALPEEFTKAKKLWQKNPESEEIIKLLAPFVGARFLPNNIDAWDELFQDESGDGFLEIEADSVDVVGVDFARGPIPICKAQAIFTVELVDGFDIQSLDEWLDEKGAHLSDAVAFYWNVDVDDDLDLTSGDNQGVECIFMN